MVQVFDQSRMGTATPMQSPTDTHMTTPGSVANEAEREPPGCGLGLNVDVMVCRAEWYYHIGAYQVTMHVCSINCSAQLWLPSMSVHVVSIATCSHTRSMYSGRTHIGILPAMPLAETEPMLRFSQCYIHHVCNILLSHLSQI